MVNAESRIERNNPYNFACDSDCRVSGMQAACLAAPLLVTGLVDSTCTPTGEGRIQLSLSEKNLSFNADVSLWVGASHASLQNVISGTKIDASCLTGVGARIPVRAYVEGTRRSPTAPAGLCRLPLTSFPSCQTTQRISFQLDASKGGVI